MTATTLTFLDADGGLALNEAEARKSGLLNSIVQCQLARDVALVLAKHLNDADILAAVYDRLSKVK